MKYSQLGVKRCFVFRNISHEGIILPVSLQILNSMPAITLLFPLLNTDQINANQSDVAGQYCYITIMPYSPGKLWQSDPVSTQRSK